METIDQLWDKYESGEISYHTFCALAEDKHQMDAIADSARMRREWERCKLTLFILLGLVALACVIVDVLR